jgi:hypothetical protein
VHRRVVRLVRRHESGVLRGAGHGVQQRRLLRRRQLRRQRRDLPRRRDVHERDLRFAVRTAGRHVLRVGAQVPEQRVLREQQHDVLRGSDGVFCDVGLHWRHLSGVRNDGNPLLCGEHLLRYARLQHGDWHVRALRRARPIVLHDRYGMHDGNVH